MLSVEGKLTRRYMQFIAVFILVTTLLPGAAFMPATVQAEISADPNEEIVYIDNTGVIRVLDTSGSPLVQWVSPTNGWEHLALGDVNNDGDQEIIATKEESGQGTLTVWDPVVLSGAFDGQINGIPWVKLYETTIPGNPRAVATGKLDPNLPGAHIVYVYNVNSGNQKLVVLKPATPTPNGRDWAVHFERDFNEQWEGISTGDVDDAGADEIMLIASSQGRVSVFKADSQSEDMETWSGQSRPYRVGVIAQYTGGGGSGKEAVVIRSADGLTSFFVFEYDNDEDQFNEKVAEAFNPSPSFAFAADINDDDKEEIVMLRRVTSGNAIRMIVRSDDQGDVPKEFEEQFLDSDNGYESGAGGDIDGDGRDEIVIMRNDKIRIYKEADRNASYDQYTVSTDKINIQIGDLDRNGFVVGSQLGVFSGANTVSTVEEALAIGATSSEKTLEVRNITNSTVEPVIFEAENNPSWLKLSTTTGNTPAPLRYQVNAINLGAGDYTARIKITSPDQNVVNQPIYVQVKLKVTAALIEAQSPNVAFHYLTSQQPVTLTRTINISGTAGVRFTAGVAPIPAVQRALATLTGELYTGALNERGELILQDDLGNEASLDLSSDDIRAATDWLSVTPAGTIPGSVTLTLKSNNQINDLEQAYLVIIGDPRTGKPPQNIRLVTVTARRGAYQLLLPTAAKGQ